MWVRVARIGKPFGVRGQVTVQVVTDAPEERLVPGALLARDDTGADPLEVTAVGRVGSRWVLTLAGVPDREAAEQLRHTQLYAPAADVSPHPGEWFDWQLIGLPCRDEAGRDLGTVSAVEHPPAQDLLVITTPDGREVRVPFVSQMVPDIGDDGVVLRPPGGLFDDEPAGSPP